MAATSSHPGVRPYWIVAAVLLALLAITLAALPASARQAEETPTEAVVDQPEDAADEEAAGGVTNDLDLTERQAWVILAILVTATLIFVAYLAVANNGQRQAYRTIERLGLRGIATRIEHVDAWQRVSAQRAGPGVQEATEATITFQVSMPDRLVVGQPVEATATVTGVDSPQLTWSASDPSVEITPQGLRARITGTKPGLFLVTVELDGQPGHTKTLPIEVAEARAAEQAAGVAIPFTNAGIATFGVLVFLLALLASLAFGRVIDGDLLMTVITTIVGGLIGAGAVAATRDSG